MPAHSTCTSTLVSLQNSMAVYACRVLKSPALRVIKALTFITLMAITLSAPMSAAVNAQISGEIERITINNKSDHWSGGTIQVGGQLVILPRNLLLDLPANRLTLQELFAQAPASCTFFGESGLAKGDTCNSSGMGGIATISANRTSAGNVIAGDVFIQKGIESITGTVSYVDYNDGYFRLSGTPGSPSTGVMVRLNDPDARHTIQQGLGCNGGSNCSPDPRFTLDGDNYTNVFTSGYPMCIPSTLQRAVPAALNLGIQFAQAQPDGSGDALCPQTNRSATGVAADSRRMAPIKIGDSILAEGNFETINGVRFLSAHSTQVQTAIATSQAPGQPDYMFLDEVEVDMPAFQNERVRSLFIGYTTVSPADVMIWGLHYDPRTNQAHETPLASSQGCDAAAGAATCAGLAFTANGTDIFKIRHDVDFLAGAKARLNPCAHLRADARMGGTSICPNGGSADTNTVEMFGILSPIPHEIQARTGRKFASMQPGGTPLITIDVSGNEATNGQYLFPFGINLGGLSPVEPVEFDLNAVSMPYYFSGLPWLLDRRLSPAGCDGQCESTPQPLDPFPFEGADPRSQASIPVGVYADPNFTSSPLTDSRNRILSFINPDTGLFGGNNTLLAFPPIDPPYIPIQPTNPVVLQCSATNNGPSNQPPVANPDSASVTAGQSVTIQVLANDTDPDGNALAVTAATPGANGTTSILNGTAVLFAANIGFSGTDTFTYTLSDGAGGTSTSTVTVTITAPVVTNSNPVANGDSATTAEDGLATITVLANDTDADADPLTITSVTQGANGTVAIAGSSVTYRPRANFNGADSFTYTISDGRGGSATASVAVTITPINDAPVAVNDATTITDPALPAQVSVLANDSDPDGNLLTVIAVGTPVPATAGTVTFAGTSVTFTANALFSGTVTIPYTVSDGQLIGTANLVVTVVGQPAGQITVTRAEYRAGTPEWRVDGTGTSVGDLVTIHLGSTLAGQVLGTAVVDATGAWSFRQRPASIPRGTNTTISVESSAGGRVLGFPISIR